MPNLRQATQFTNIPGREEDWTYTPDLPWWRDYEKEQGTTITGDPERVTVETPEGGGFAGRPEELPAAREMMRERPQPPEDFVAPDYGPEGEKRFEQEIFNQIEQKFGIPGGNPYMYNPGEEIKRVDAQLPGIFKTFFRGQATWRDYQEGRLDSDQAKEWDRVVREFHSSVEEDVGNRHNAAINAYKYMKSQWDEERKFREAEVKKIGERGKEERKRVWEREKMGLGEERQIRKEERAEKRKGEPETKPVDLKRLFDMNQKLEKELSETGKISPNSLRIYNELAKTLGQEQIVKTKEAKKGWKIPLVDITIGGEGAEYGAAGGAKKVVRTGTHKGRRVIEYDDGSVSYAD